MAAPTVTPLKDMQKGKMCVLKSRVQILDSQQSCFHFLLKAYVQYSCERVKKNTHTQHLTFNFWDTLQTCMALRGYCTPDQKLACFVLYLKIINTFLKNNLCIL